MKRNFEMTWQHSKDFITENRFDIYIPEGSEIMPAGWKPEKGTKGFNFLDHVEVTHKIWFDYVRKNHKHAIRTPATRDGESCLAHVIDSHFFWTGERGDGYSHQDYWGEWDCESNWWVPDARIPVLVCKTDKHSPIFYASPDDVTLVTDDKINNLGQHVLSFSGDRRIQLFHESAKTDAVRELLQIPKADAERMVAEAKEIRKATKQFP